MPRKNITLTVSRGKWAKSCIPEGKDQEFFEVKKVRNSLEWDVGQKLTRREVDGALGRPNVTVDIVK